MSTLADPRHRASDPQVKGESKFGETPRKRHWWQRAEVEVEPAPRLRSTFPNPDADTRVLPRVTPPAAVTPPPVLYRERPADLDKAAYNIALTANSAGLNRWSAIKLEEQLAKHLRVVHALAQQERAEGLKLLERPANAEAANAAVLDDLRSVVDAEQKANELPGVTVKAHVDTDALGSGLGAVWANAHQPLEETAQFQRIAPGMPDPRVQVSVTTVTVDKPASPVHAPFDGSTPPVPAEDDELADPGAAKPLPKRVPQRRPVDVLPYSDKDPYAAVDPTVEGQGLESGAWVLDEGSPSTGAVWFLLAGQEDRLREGGGLAVLKFANGVTRDVYPGKQVKVLDVRRAQVLLAEHEHKLAARDAENAGAER